MTRVDWAVYFIQRGKAISMHAHRDLSKQMPSDRAKQETNRPYCGPPRKVELFHARKSVHARDRDPYSRVPQDVQLLHELIVIFGINPCLPQPYREMEVITGLEFPPSLQARQSDRPNRTPPGAHPGKAKDSEAVRCARNRLCLIMAADSSAIIAQSKTTGRSISVLSVRSCSYSVDMEGNHARTTSWFVLA